jgi:hypothetical protein
MNEFSRERFLIAVNHIPLLRNNIKRRKRLLAALDRKKSEIDDDALIIMYKNKLAEEKIYIRQNRRYVPKPLLARIKLQNLCDSTVAH